ncbi:MAG: hypothetical protein HY673_19485 [Chloroflexi bacterium]|nr:hypothetical protein [Chloroflexota bacterium]
MTKREDSKFQAPNTKQYQNPQCTKHTGFGFYVLGLKIGGWNFFGIWNLAIVIYLVIRHSDFVIRHFLTRALAGTVACGTGRPSFFVKEDKCI